MPSPGMDPIELRDSNAARRFLAHGLWLQRSRRPRPEAVKSVLQWALEAAAAGQPLPPSGFLADLGLLLTGDADAGPRDLPSPPGFPPGLTRTYEDIVLGKLFDDAAFARAADVVRRLTGRDRARAVAFVADQFRQQAGYPGVWVSPAVVKAMLEQPGDHLLRGAWEEMSADGPFAELLNLTEALVPAVRRCGAVLAAEDLFELEHGTAWDDLAQRVALRQVLHLADQFGRRLPALKVRPAAGRREVPTRVFDDDVYPVGGFSAIGTRGSLESLLHSQLAYMEPAGGDRPDLFDIKFLRDELLYYTRDENQFRRRRRTFVFALFPDLVQARYKDRDLPGQRLILALAWLTAVTRRLIDWLSADALAIEFLLPGTGKDLPLESESKLLRTIFRDAIRGRVVFVSAPETANEVGQRVVAAAAASECRALWVSTQKLKFVAGSAVIHGLRVAGPRPELSESSRPIPLEPDGEPFDIWSAAAERLLAEWV